MLLFKPEHISMIQDGMKKETRRLWEKPRAKVGAIHLIKTKLFTKENFGKVRIEYRRHEQLLNITDEGAWWEGRYTREQYLKLWKEINPESPENPWVWVVGFTYLGRE